jgi:hypothetical protein
MPAGLPPSSVDPAELVFEAFGVRVLVASPTDELDRVRAMLPPGSRACAPTRLSASFVIAGGASDGYEVSRDGEALAGDLKLDLALEILQRELHWLIALEAPHHVFVHAGAVGHKGAAILVPGSSHAGKTTLVAALVRAGAEYYSDDFAPLDPQGKVHPFAKPLSLRDERWRQVDHHVDALGGRAGERPLRVGAVVVTTYGAGAEWRPRRLSGGQATLALLSHTVRAQTSPAQALRVINRAVDGATAIESARGEADLVAPLLLAELEAGLSARRSPS